MDKIDKLIFSGILLCLMIISWNLYNNQTNKYLPIKYDINTNSENIIQIGENRIAVVDNGTHTGYKGQLLIFDYDISTKTFRFATTFNYENYLNHPENYGIPIKD